MASSDYIEKLKFIGGIDPYALKTSDFNASFDEIPKISKNVVLDYFLFSVSPSTYFEIRAYKSLDAFAQLACKWIESLCAKKYNDNFLIMGKVRHSQRVSEAPLKPWVILSQDGRILTGHCTCVAGLGAVCTHVAAILFALEFAGTKSDEQSVTDTLAYWIGPSRKGQFYKKLSDIDFTTPSKLLQDGSEAISDVGHSSFPATPVAGPSKISAMSVAGPSILPAAPFTGPSRISTTSVAGPSILPATPVAGPSRISATSIAGPSILPATPVVGPSRISAMPVAGPSILPATSVIPSLTKDEMDAFTKKSVELGVMPAYAVKDFVSLQTLDEKYPICLTSLFDENYVGLNLAELLMISETITLDVTEEQVSAAYEDTVDQSKSKLWLKLRTGRITASKFKSVCQTKIENPAISLIKSICHPQTKLFKAGIYGCEHESDALTAYIDDHRKSHKNAYVEKCGLIIHVNYPYLGATPDGFLHCEECGTGCIEVKCPYCVRDVSVEEIVNFKSSCLVLDKDNYVLDKKHSYYYQVQMQLALSRKRFCDFVVWTSKSFLCQRITRDENFWHHESKKAERFFHEVLLPELLGHYFTQKQSNN